MSTIGKIVADFTTQLSDKAIVGAVTATIQSVTDDDGNTIANGTYYLTIDGNNNQKEYIQCTLTGTALTAIYSISRQGTLTSGLAREHRAGALVELTDYSIISVLRAILNGDTAIPNAIKYDTGVAPVTSDDLVDKAYVDALAMGGSLTIDQLVTAGTAGETIVDNDLVYLKVSDNRWWKVDADDSTTLENTILGIAKGAGTAGNAISSGVLLKGLKTGLTGLTANTKYYASNTGGAISTSAGTKEVTVGMSISTTTLLFYPRFDQEITEDIQDALEGSTGVPKSTNKFVTQDNTSEATTDQTQTTQNSTIETGEADIASKKNLIAQSFIPAKTKIRGVKLYKSADSGTFTGTVVITLQADSSGSPSGTPLATVTLTNTQWLALAVGEFEAIFTTEYQSMTVGSLYWIVIDPSTSDTTNHPNLGTNSAGGYGSGSVKYKNTTDSWVAVSTIDLYFKTLEGNTAQMVKTNSSGKIESAFYDVSEMPVPAYYQRIEITEAAMDTGESYMQGFGSNQTGSVFYSWTTGGSMNYELKRFERDSITGMYLLTHTINPTLSIAGSQYIGMVVVGDYLYIFSDGGANLLVTRFLAADLTGETSPTIPVLAVGGANAKIVAWTDGTFIYFVVDGANTVRKYSISGSTLTEVTTGTAVTTIKDYARTSMFDGTNVYVSGSDSATGYYRTNIYKLTDIFGTAVSTTYKNINVAGSSTSIHTSGMVNIDTNRVYVAKANHTAGVSTTVKMFIELTPITKP